MKHWYLRCKQKIKANMTDISKRFNKQSLTQRVIGVLVAVLVMMLVYSVLVKGIMYYLRVRYG